VVISRQTFIAKHENFLKSVSHDGYSANGLCPVASSCRVRRFDSALGEQFPTHNWGEHLLWRISPVKPNGHVPGTRGTSNQNFLQGLNFVMAHEPLQKSGEDVCRLK
jgi:hypothetical protein